VTISAVAKGQYWKGRTKKWLEAQGYQVAFLERVLWLQTARGRIPIKRDQFASDLLAVNLDEVIFVQVKGGVSRRTQLAAARLEFAKFAFPAGTQQWIVCWAPRARLPEVIVCSAGPCGELAASLRPAKRRKLTKADLPLFAGAR
jgi:hypothetical protein